MKRQWFTFRAIVGALMFLTASTALGACDSTMTEAEMLKWTHNEVGLKRITQAVADEEQPIRARIRALEVVVERGFALRVRSMIDAVQADSSRQTITKGLVDGLLGQIERGTEAQLDAKDAVMALELVIEPSQWQRARSVIAKWAFTGLAWETPAGTVEKQIEGKISAGQIISLGPLAHRVCGILISNGLEVDKLVRFLGSAKSDDATTALLKGLRKLHGTIGVQGFHLDALRATGSSASVAYLLEMYMNSELDDEFRASAFNVAVDMMDKKEATTGSPDRVLAQLLNLIDTTNPEDRWLGAASIISISGVDKLDDVMKAFKDDGVYANAEADTARSVMDFCLDIRDQGQGAKALPIFDRYMKTGNRVQKAISIVCLKANDSPDLTELSRLAASVGQEGDVDVNDLLGDEMTLGRLALNAISGLQQLADLRSGQKSGQYNSEQAKTLRLLITFELERAGDEYRALVAARYKAWLVEQAEAKADAAKAPAVVEPNGDQ